MTLKLNVIELCYDDDSRYSVMPISDSIMTNSNRVLYLYQPERHHLIYNPRELSHNR